MIRLKHLSLIVLPLVTLLITFLFMEGSSQQVETQTDFQAVVSLQCTNQPFQGEAVLVTDMEQPLQFLCQVQLKQAVPEGYVPAPIEYHWSVPSGTLSGSGNQCSWSHPEPGVQKISVSGSLRYLPPPKEGFFSRQDLEISVPFSASLPCVIPRKVGKDLYHNGTINGFVVGEYPDPTNPADLAKSESREAVSRNAEQYLPPEYFYQLTPQNFFLKVFKDYILGEFDLDPRFLPPQDYPHYIAIHPGILTKLEMLRELMNEHGIPVTKFKFIYFFRCPSYNLGAKDSDGEDSLKSSFSMHMYGKAADMIIDEDDDMRLDDLNKDGVLTYHDAIEFIRYVNMLDKKLLAEGSDLVGGAGWYYHHDYYQRGEQVAQTPYVHMDVRGYTRPDGSLVRWVGEDALGIRSGKDKDPFRIRGEAPPYPWEVGTSSTN
ncbi:MAG: hypothetical protein ACOX5R_12300 [bacterium]|jgi:hypothetical protein